MGIKIDFTGVTTLDTSPIPAGTYFASVSACKPKAASTGTPMLEFQFVIEDDGDYDGRRVFTNAMLTPKALWKLKGLLSGLGFTREELDGEFELDPAELIGLTGYIVVVQKQLPRDGATVNDVLRVIDEEAYNEDGTGQLEPSYDYLEEEDDEEDAPVEDEARWVAPDEDEDEDEPDEDEPDEDEDEDEPAPISATKAAARMIQMYDLDASDIPASGTNGAITKEDVVKYLAALDEDEE